MCSFNLASDAMKGQITCQWLVIGSMELCGKSSLGDYNKIHLVRLRRGPGTQSWMGCGRGVKPDWGYVWTVVIIKLECVTGKGGIGLLWSELKGWRLSNYNYLDVFFFVGNLYPIHVAALWTI